MGYVGQYPDVRMLTFMSKPGGMRALAVACQHKLYSGLRIRIWYPGCCLFA